MRRQFSRFVARSRPQWGVCLAAFRPRWGLSLGTSLLGLVLVRWQAARSGSSSATRTTRAGAALKNPARDADAMAAVLRGLGFYVIQCKDLGRREMDDVL